jgi:hypothetical protein
MSFIGAYKSFVNSRLGGPEWPDFGPKSDAAETPYA